VSVEPAGHDGVGWKGTGLLGKALEDNLAGIIGKSGITVQASKRNAVDKAKVPDDDFLKGLLRAFLNIGLEKSVSVHHQLSRYSPRRADGIRQKTGKVS
jgi:hypothetical protein